MTTLRVGTRGSALALWQANRVADLLKASGVETELVILKTTGDRVQDAPLSEAGGKRVFVKEIDDALLAGDVHIAVHSAKDMPADRVDGLVVAAALARDDPRDAVILPASKPLRAAPALEAVHDLLGREPIVGTSSVRRSAQLRVIFPHASFAPIRGNVDTRLRKLDDGGYDALVLAAAGLNRLGLSSRITAPLEIEHCVPAPGQGIIAVEARAGDRDVLRILKALNDPPSEASLLAERALVSALGGGCQLPLGGIALHANGELLMHALVASLDGTRVLKGTGRAPASGAESLGHRIAGELLDAGAGDLLAVARSGALNLEQNRGPGE